MGFLIVLGANTNLTVTINNPQCSDTLDNDGDTFIDYPADPQCVSSLDNDEQNNFQCSDTLDNDGDTLVDSFDPQCHTDGNASNIASYDPTLNVEQLLFQCNDGIDNDGDTFIDYPADPDCSSSTDDDEFNHGSSVPPDTTPPYVVSFTPSNNAMSVSSTTIVAMTFDNSINLVGGSVLIKEFPSNTVFDTISVLGPRASLAGGVVLSLSPISNFVSGKTYYIELPAGLVADTSGNLFAGVTGSSGWKFSIADTQPPAIGNVIVSPNATETTLTWDTNKPSTSVYSWGLDTSYSLGSITDPTFLNSHSALITGLLPLTTYYYKLRATDSLGNFSEYTGQFTTLLIPDIIPPANPSVFIATPDIDFIKLTWTNPSDIDFSLVRILRSTVSYPLSPLDSGIIYEGSGNSVNDIDVLIGEKYYYTIFAKDTSGNFSSGALATAKILAPIIITPPVDIPPTITPVTPPIVPIDTPPLIAPIPFDQTINTGTSGLFSLFLIDFNFYERGRLEKQVYPKKDSIHLDSNKNLKISVANVKLPTEVSSIVLRIQNFEIGKKESSFLLSSPDGISPRSAILELRGLKGIYPLTIDVYDEHKKLLARVFGVMNLEPRVAPVVSIFTPATTEQIILVTDNIAPTAVPVGIAIGVSQGVLLATNVNSLYDVYLLLLRFIGVVSGFFRRKKRQPWGVVYDSVTKQPIDPAYVVMKNVKGDSKMKTAITDLDGRYGFLVESGEYSIMANKTHYQFPSTLLANKKKDEMYDNLYFGDAFDADENKVIRYNIPLDPVEFDWNEFTKNKDHIFHLYSRKEKIKSFIFNTLFIIGFSVSVITLIFSPTTLNFVLFGVYSLILIFQSVWRYNHKVTRLLDREGNPVSFAIVTAELSGLTIPVMKKVSTDMLGRFYLMTQPGTYDIKISTKQPDASYIEVYHQPSVVLKNGVLTSDIILP